MSKLNLTFVIVAAAVLMFGLQTANAEITDTMNSAYFTWKYEMAVDPSGQDLDNTTYPGVDWDFYRGVLTVNDDETVTMSDEDGDKDYGTIRTLGTSDVSYSPATHSGNVWRNISNATGFTIEASIKVIGTDGGLYIIADDYGYAPKHAPLVIEDDGTHWANDTPLADANNDIFHTFRIAQEPNSNTYTVWRDDELLGTGLTDKNAGAFQRLGIGDMSSIEGPYIMDYVRITKGAYAPAPIPEPSTFALLAAGLIGLLAYAWRKRK